MEQVKYITVKDLVVYQLARKLSSLAWKIYEKMDWQLKKIIGDQFITATDSVGANIVEGYGRRKYKAEFIRFLIFSHSSCDETIVHLKFISDLYSNLKEEADVFIERYTELSKKIYKFIEYVENEWKV